VYLSLYLFYFMRLGGGAEDLLDLLVVLFPTAVACWVGMTRIIDNYHHPSDVVGGAFTHV
jgi:membrane-associated phospholipid phosphatase